MDLAPKVFSDNRNFTSFNSMASSAVYSLLLKNMISICSKYIFTTIGWKVGSGYKSIPLKAIPRLSCFSNGHLEAVERFLPSSGAAQQPECWPIRTILGSRNGQPGIEDSAHLQAQPLRSHVSPSRNYNRRIRIQNFLRKYLIQWSSHRRFQKTSFAALPSQLH